MKSIESFNQLQVFAGYLQRYNTDIGAKYFFFEEDSFDWDIEAGYRYSVENRLAGQVTQNYARAYSEANRKFNKAVSLKLGVEYLQNFTFTADHQINGELSFGAILNEVLSLKTGYVMKYRSILPPPATFYLDTQLLTALVAKF